MFRFSPSARSCSEWANRILIVSLAGILCLTLFPFRFDAAFRHPAGASAFLLGPSSKHLPFWDWFLNILLFLPFGFGLSAQLRKREVRRTVILGVAFAAGAITSYAVEFLQFYIPSRNSGWDDLPPNIEGTLAGSLLLILLGEPLLGLLTKWELRLDAGLSIRRVWLIVAAYLVVWFSISIPLQLMTRLSDWDASMPLLVGNDATARHAWKGQIYRLQIWRRAVPDDLARKLTAGEVAPGEDAGLLASYEFTGSPPYQDQRKTLPDLAWISSTPPPPRDAKALDLDGSSWLRSAAPMSGLAAELKSTHQFAVRAVCAPANVAELDQRVISISSASGWPNLSLRRVGASLVVWFRNPISLRQEQLNWNVRGVFAPGKVRDILVSYDGSTASLYVDGEKIFPSYHLSPGAGLVREFYRVRTTELGAYLVLYDTVIFVPAGLLLGLLAGRWSSLGLAGKALLFFALLFPGAFFEWILAQVSGRERSLWQLGLCVILTLLGAWLLNADRWVGYGFWSGWGALLRRDSAAQQEEHEVAAS
jgi:glycopeptide antibiotics resistance protein